MREEASMLGRIWAGEVEDMEIQKLGNAGVLGEEWDQVLVAFGGHLRRGRPTLKDAFPETEGVGTHLCVEVEASSLSERKANEG